MRIDGKDLAKKILWGLKRRVTQLKKRGRTPTLGIVIVGDDPASLSFIRQKQDQGKVLEAQSHLVHLPEDVSQEELNLQVSRLNQSSDMHGVIIQLPLPGNFRGSVPEISREKDVDGFCSNSTFIPPVAMATLRILEYIYRCEKRSGIIKSTFKQWFQTKTYCVIGRGPTAGKPVADLFKKKGLSISVVHSKTSNPKLRIREADVVVSCVGKSKVLTLSDIKDGAIVIGVGLHTEEGKLKGDYRGLDLADKASYYTPTPGGVGPVNVACLWENVIIAAEPRSP